MRDYIKREDAIAILERLRDKCGNDEMSFALNWAANIVRNMTAAYVVTRARWIPVTERLPEGPYGCLLIVWDSPSDGGDDFLNYLTYFAGWDGEQWNDDNGIQVPFEVAYWMPLPQLPKGDANMQNGGEEA